MTEPIPEVAEAGPELDEFVRKLVTKYTPDDHVSFEMDILLMALSMRIVNYDIHHAVVEENLSRAITSAEITEQIMRKLQ